MTDWTAPMTWSATPVKDAILNAQIRDNIMNLKDPATASYSYAYTGATFLSTTSTTWVAMGSPLSLTLETFGGDVFLFFNATVSNAYLDFAVDDARQGGGDGILAVPTLAVYGVPTRMVWPLPELAAGTHTFDVYWKVASGTGSLFRYVPPQFVVREMS